MDQHVRDDLSAYLDGALPPAERAVVQAHLDACPACRAAHAELRATARVIAAMPLLKPARRLVPALGPRFAWLRPMRSLSAVLAGAFLFVFMASATLDTGWRMGGGRTSGPGVGTAAQPAGQDARARATFPPSGLTQPAATDTRGRIAPAAAPSPERALREAARPGVLTSPAPTGGQGERTDSALGAEAPRAAPEPLRIGPTPWLWLGLAVLSGILALVAHRRLRAR